MDANTPNVNPPAPQPGDVPPPRPPETMASWFKANGTSALTTAAFIAAVCYFLHPLDVLLAIVGLGGIVFIHELGHFLAAKACGVHVKTFAVGFGPPLPFCHFRYGETHYKLAMIPLGGYVAMVGEGDPKTDAAIGAGAVDDPDEPETFDKDYPRSFANKPVWQRMIVISAGVIMNMILAAVCFVVVYLHGVEEQPAVAQAVDPGSAAWRAGLRPGEELVKLNELENNPSENKKRLWFDDIRPVVSSTQRGETVSVTTVYQGQTKTYEMEPVRAEGGLFPVIGISPPQSLTLFASRRDANPPFDAGSPAARAKTASGAGFQGRDKVVAMTDPATGSVTPLPESADGGQFEFRRRLHRLAGKDVTVRVQRAGTGDTIDTADIVLPKTYRKDIGLRMKPGQVTAVRTGSSAEKAGVLTRVVAKGEVEREGDEVLEVTVRDGGKPVTLSATADPLRLPMKLFAWADGVARLPEASRDWAVTVKVRRAGAELVLPMTWDDSYRTEPAPLLSPVSPIPLDGLGLAYQVSSTVSEVTGAAAKAGIRPGDVVTQVRFKAEDFKGKQKDGAWQPVGDFHYAFLDSTLQLQAPHTLDLKVKRGEEEIEVSGLAAADDESWPVAAGGLIFGKELRTLKADDIGEALGLGWQRTVRMVKNTYQGLYALVAGRVSVKVMSGPITLARAGYILAGESVWKLILLVGLISINLAVVNFLPIPVLDGGHMVFLIYEGLRGKPAPVLVQNVLTIVGLAMVLSLMLFTIGLDIWRLLFW